MTNLFKTAKTGRLGLKLSTGQTCAIGIAQEFLLIIN